MKSDATFVSVNVRSRKNCIGSIGEDARSSHATNAATSSTPATMGTTMPALVQPWSFPRTSPHTIPRSPVLASPSPGRSRARSPPCDSSRREYASGASTSPIGTFTQKIQCHETPLTIAPPTSGPSATARPPMPAEAVAERRASEQQHCERERVRVHRPLELRDGRVQVAADHRQGGRDDEVVEADHEERERGDRKRPVGDGLVTVVSHHYLLGEKKSAYGPLPHPSSSVCAQGSGFSITCIDASTLSSIPVAKNLEISSGGSPDTRCA